MLRGPSYPEAFTPWSSNIPFTCREGRGNNVRRYVAHKNKAIFYRRRGTTLSKLLHRKLQKLTVVQYQLLKLGDDADPLLLEARKENYYLHERSSSVLVDQAQNTQFVTKRTKNE